MQTLGYQGKMCLKYVINQIITQGLGYHQCQPLTIINIMESRVDTSGNN